MKGKTTQSTHDTQSVLTKQFLALESQGFTEVTFLSLGNQVMRAQGIETVSKESLIAPGERMDLGLEKAPVCSKQPREIRTNGHLRFSSSQEALNSLQDDLDPGLS